MASWKSLVTNLGDNAQNGRFGIELSQLNPIAYSVWVRMGGPNPRRGYTRYNRPGEVGSVFSVEDVISLIEDTKDYESSTQIPLESCRLPVTD